MRYRGRELGCLGGIVWFWLVGIAQGTGGQDVMTIDFHICTYE